MRRWHASVFRYPEPSDEVFVAHVMDNAPFSWRVQLSGRQWTFELGWYS